jgi:hypothetical protein
MFHELLSRDRETGNPLVVDAACGAGLSGLSRRSFSEDGSAAIKCKVTNQEGEPVVEYGSRYLVACRDS